MNCRICEMKCENDAPQFHNLCRACGQKRETYAAASTGPVLAVLLSQSSTSSPEERRTRMIDTIFNFAEAMVRRDRKPLSGSDPKGA